MKLFLYEQHQMVPAPAKKVWDFFSDPANLREITPPHMRFEIRSRVSARIFSGQIISYTVRPLLGLPVSWVTEITQLQEPVSFVDEQRFGPYRFWHHHHRFESVRGGVKMTDTVHYALPVPVFESTVNRWIVEPKLDEIFQYRREKIQKLFG